MPKSKGEAEEANPQHHRTSQVEKPGPTQEQRHQTGEKKCQAISHHLPAADAAVAVDDRQHAQTGAA